MNDNMEAQLKNLFDVLPGGFLITDATSRVVYANESVAKRSGFAVAEIIGKKPGELWGGRMPRTFYQSMWHTIRTTQKPFIGTVENKKKNGQALRETLHIAPLKNSQGHPRYFVELHPILTDNLAPAAFDFMFTDRMEHWHEDGRVWQWIVEMLAHDKTVPLSLVERGQSVEQQIEATFVAPTQQKLARRWEDGLLMQAAKAEPAAYAALYDKYQLIIRGYFLRRLGERMLAEDLTQEVFAKAFRYLPSFRVTNASYYTYLLHIAHSILVNYYRQESRSRSSFSVESLEEVAEEVPAPASFPLDWLLTGLTATEQEVMLAVYRDGYRAKEIAQNLGKSENAVKLILSRARKKLRLLPWEDL